MKHENQWEFVRKRLNATPRDQWTQVAASAGLNLRTLYNVVDPTSNPRYQTVFNLYASMKNRAARAAK